MLEYAFATVILVLLTSTFILRLLHKKKLLTFQYRVSIILSSIGSIFISILYPISLDAYSNVFFIKISLSILIAFITYFTIVLVVTIFISSVISEKTAKNILEYLNKQFEKIKFYTNKIKNIQFSKKYEKESLEKPQDSLNNNEKIEENSEITENFVDTQINIDKMGVEELSDSLLNEKIEVSDFEEFDEDEVETLVDEDYEDNSNKDIVDSINELQTFEEPVTFENQFFEDKENLSVHDYIERAFNYKSQERFIETIECYMDALEVGPDDNTIFLIILDICVIYKNLGKSDLAKDILLSYLEVYGNIMNEDIKNEIIRNL